jgi:hypothetical protein
MRKALVAVVLGVVTAALAPSIPAAAAPVNLYPLQFVVEFSKTPGADITRPQGQFFQIGLSAANVGTQPQSLNLSSQSLVDSAGRTYGPDLGATALFSGAAFRPTPEINPGNTWRGFLFFDVPYGTQESDYRLVLQSPGGTASVQLRSCGSSQDPCGVGGV